MAGQDNHVYGFSGPDARQILQKLGIGGGGESQLGQRGHSGAYILLTPSTIAARSGTTISSANCTIYTGEGGTLASTGVTVPVYNLSTTAIASGVYIIALFAGGIMVCNWEDC